MALPDAERNAVQALLASASVTAFTGPAGVFTEWPTKGDKPERAVRVTRIGGSPTSSKPARLDRALLQLECYGGPKRTSQQLLEAVRDALSASIGPATEGVITRVAFGGSVYSPDPDRGSGKPAPRYVLTATLFQHI